MAHEIADRRAHDDDLPKLARQTSKKLKETSTTAVHTVACMPIRMACCLCTSMHGVLQLMRSETTREFALAVVVGDAFNAYIQSFAEDLIQPILMSLFSVGAWTTDCIGSCTSGILIVGKNGTTYTSTSQAAQDDALFVNVGSFISSTVAFTLSLLTICARIPAHRRASPACQHRIAAVPVHSSGPTTDR